MLRNPILSVLPPYAIALIGTGVAKWPAKARASSFLMPCSYFFRWIEADQHDTGSSIENGTARHGESAKEL